MHTNNKIATEDDLYDVVLASSSYLYASGEFSRRRNRQTRPRRFWVHDVLRRRDDLAEYARLVQELPLDSGYFRMSTEQFDYVLGLVGPYILRLSTVNMAVHVQGRTTSYNVSRTQCERRLSRRKQLKFKRTKKGLTKTYTDEENKSY